MLTKTLIAGAIALSATAGGTAALKPIGVELSAGPMALGANTQDGAFIKAAETTDTQITVRFKDGRQFALTL